MRKWLPAEGRDPRAYQGKGTTQQRSSVKTFGGWWEGIVGAGGAGRRGSESNGTQSWS